MHFLGSKSKEFNERILLSVKRARIMWERFREVLEARGAQVHLNAEALGVTHEDGRISHLRYVKGQRR
jgi:hypothetical protein